MNLLDFIHSNKDEKVGNDTVEGIAFSRDTAVIMTGVFVNEEEVSTLLHYYTITLLQIQILQVDDWSLVGTSPGLKINKYKYTITNTNTNTIIAGGLVPCEQDGALLQTLVLSPRKNFSTNGRPGFCR